MAKEIVNPKSVCKPMGPYSQGVVATGRKLVFISGQVPQDSKGDLVGRDDIDAQTRQVLTNLRNILEEIGGTLSDIVKITVFMVETTAAALETVARVREEFFGSDFPASTLVAVKSLASPDWLVEMEAFAVL
jgi:reactive intermediate/imine deaminase